MNIRTEGDTAILTLPSGEEVFLDAADVHLIAGYRWYRMRDNQRGITLAQGVRKTNGRCEKVQMHRLIFGFTKGVGRNLRHRDGNGLNNRRSNLETTGSLNGRSRGDKTKLTTTTPFKGVTRRRKHGSWFAAIKIAGRVIYLGSYPTDVDAAVAYDQAARQHFGPHARTNEDLGHLPGWVAE